MKVTAVVVHWRDADETVGCVAALASDGIDHVVVVDNGGTPPVEDRVRAAAPAAVLVRSETNLGYAGGANLGIVAALRGGADIVLLLNDDARVRPGATAAAVQRLASDPRIGVVGPKVLLRDDPTRLWLAWGDLTWRQSVVALHGADAVDGPSWNMLRDVDWVAGCALWLRGKALGALGGFDEAFFAYHEEVEWCTRARRAGWRVVYDPAVLVEHGGRGSGTHPASVRIRKYFTARNGILLARKHGTVAERLRLAGFLMLSLPLQLLRHLPTGGAGNVWLKVRGIRDGLLGRRPPFEDLGLR